MKKEALALPGLGKAVGKALDVISVSPQKAMGVGGLVAGGAILHKAYANVQNDVRRKNLFNDLRLNDPVLSQVPEEQLLEWYATIYHFAPKFSLDKSAVREVLQNFARFGRVDANTLKMLADTEKATQQADAAGKSWGALFGDFAKAITLGG
jgi:lipoate-protein ligase A